MSKNCTTEEAMIHYGKVVETTGMQPEVFIKLLNTALEMFNRPAKNPSVSDLTESVSITLNQDGRIRVTADSCNKNLHNLEIHQVYQVMVSLLRNLSLLSPAIKQLTDGFQIMKTQGSNHVGLVNGDDTIEIVFKSEDDQKCGHYDVLHRTPKSVRYLRIHGDGYCGWYSAIFCILTACQYVEDKSFIPVPMPRLNLTGGFLETSGEFIYIRTVKCWGPVEAAGATDPSNREDRHLTLGTNAPDCSGDERLAKELAAQFDKELEAQRLEQISKDFEFALTISGK